MLNELLLVFIQWHFHARRGKSYASALEVFKTHMGMNAEDMKMVPPEGPAHIASGQGWPWWDLAVSQVGLGRACSISSGQTAHMLAGNLRWALSSIETAGTVLIPERGRADRMHQESPTEEKGMELFVLVLLMSHSLWAEWEKWAWRKDLHQEQKSTHKQKRMKSHNKPPPCTVSVGRCRLHGGFCTLWLW